MEKHILTLGYVFDFEKSSISLSVNVISHKVKQTLKQCTQQWILKSRLNKKHTSEEEAKTLMVNGEEVLSESPSWVNKLKIQTKKEL